MSSSKKTGLKRDFAVGVYLSEAPSPPTISYTLPPPLTHCKRVRVYCILIHTGKGGGKRRTREKVRGATVHKAGSKIPT